MKQKSNKKNNYKLGSYVTPKYADGGFAKFANYNTSSYGAPIGTVGNMVGGAIGGSTGNVVNGIASGAAAGAALGPIGMGVGALFGAGASLLSNKKAADSARNARADAYTSSNQFYQDSFNSSLDTNNENAYGNLSYANGSFVGNPDDIAKGNVMPDDRQHWNGFVDYVAKKGYAGSDKLDSRDTKLSRKLFDEYSKSTGKAYDYDTYVPAIQGEISKYRDNSIQKIKAGQMAVTNPDGSVYKGDRNTYDYDNNFMVGLSNVDGWAGSKTTAWKFPGATLVENGISKEIPNNLYSNNRKMANGGDVPIDLINIQKGELQIDPQTGKILREYTGMNPETGGLYTPHSKGKDPKHNFVTAEPGTFIITTAEAKKYKDAVDNNDKLHQNSILQNIKNYKDKVDPQAKMANGSFVNPGYLFAPGAQTNGTDLYNPRIAPISPVAQMNTQIAPVSIGNVPTQSTGAFGNGLSKAGDFLTNYGPALMNIGQGIFGNVEQQGNVNPTINPYKSQILNNMPQDVSLDPIRQQLMRNQNTAFSQIDNTTSSNPIARANKQNVFANTQNQLGNFAMQVQGQNNQIRGQRASIYQGLGAQEMQSQDRAQQINLGINESNLANRAAKKNLLTTGLSQLQQTYQNDKLNRSRQSIDKYKVDLLKQMFPNLKYYGDQFGSDALTKLIGQ